MENLEQKQNKETIGKEELESLANQIELENLKNEVISQNWKKFIPEKYQSKIEKLDNQEKIGYVYLFKLGEEFLGKDQLNNLVNILPLEEITPFLYELAILEKQKDLEKNIKIILTQEEIKELKKILASNATKNKLTKLKEFIEEQSQQNITSNQLIKGSNLEKILEKEKINLNTFDEIFFKYLEKNYPNISKDTLRNMATGITLFLIKTYNNLDGKVNFNQFLSVEGLKSLINSNSISAFKKLNEILNILKKEKNKNLNQDLLNNPTKFSNFLQETLSKNLSKDKIKSKLIKKTNTPIFNKETKAKLQNQLKNEFNKTAQILSKPENKEQLNGLKELEKSVESIKGNFEKFKNTLQHKIVNEYGDTIIGFVDFLKKIGVYKWLKEIFDSIFKLLGFENFKNFENIIEKKKFPDILDWLKENITFKKIKTHKNSIFYTKEYENPKTINIKVDGKLSYTTLKWIKTTQKEQVNFLENLFTKDYFNVNIFPVLELKESEFYKKLYKEPIEKDGKQILVINFNYLNKILEKYIEKTHKPQKIEEEAVNYYNYEAAKIEINKKEISDLIEKKEEIFNKEVKNLFGLNFSYKKYTYAIGQIESGQKYNITNKIGALGKYQFMPNTLQDYKKEICGNKNCSEEEIKNTFLHNPELQEKIMAKYTMSHLRLLKINKIKPKNTQELVKLLAKCHVTGCGNLDKNYSDGNIKANKYAQKANNIYENLA